VPLFVNNLFTGRTADSLSPVISPLALSYCSNAHWFFSGLETLLLGGSCATVAFTIGHFVNELVGADDATL
jgi:hypothetical protein